MSLRKEGEADIQITWQYDTYYHGFIRDFGSEEEGSQKKSSRGRILTVNREYRHSKPCERGYIH